MLISATIIALAVFKPPTTSYKPLVDAFDKQAAKEGFHVSEESTRYFHVDPASGRPLLARVARSGNYRIEASVALVPDAKIRRDMLRSFAVTQAGQFPIDMASLKGSGTQMFSFGARPSEVFNGASWASSVGAYGQAGDCILFTWLDKTNGAKPEASSKQHAIDALAAITSAISKVAWTVPNQAAR